MSEEASIPSWRTVSKKTVAENPFLKLEEHAREEEGGSKRGDFFIVQAPDWGNVVALTDAGDVVLIEQFRQGSETIEIEVPGGIIHDHEDPADAILRELTEETGYERSADTRYFRIGQVTPNPAFINNTCYTYLATNVRPSGVTAFDEHENIRVRLVPRKEIRAMIARGEIRHSLTVVALYFMELAGY